MKYISNALSLNMFPAKCTLHIEPVNPQDIPDVVSAIGHESTAQIVSKLLGRTYLKQRTELSLNIGDEVYITAIYKMDGTPFRPKEGQILTFEDFSNLKIEFRKVTVAE